MTLQLLNDETADAHASDALLERARRLRATADALEAEALRAGPPFGHWAEVLHGDWRALRSDARRVGALESPGRRRLGEAAATEAIVAALTGDDAGARTAAVRAERVEPHESRIDAGVSIARAVSWLSQGNANAAFTTAAALFARRPDAAPIAGAAGLLAETAAFTHREDEARRLLRPTSVPTGAAVEESMLASALLAGDDADDAMRSLLVADSLHGQFGRARLHLALGMRLRRHHARSDAVRHIQEALDHFVGLGATPWIRVARSELRASGMRQTARDDVRLSEQQLRIAVLAARGLSNREIGERLFLSPRTVGSHLYRIYPKLGIASRHQLASRLAQRPPTA